ncbi:MAG: hypothetical protein ACAI38_24775 [Myxococcota bacterium]|nr:hypothetical protein [Myxococcota bacterium]
MLKRLAPFALVLLAACAKNKVQPPPGSGEAAANAAGAAGVKPVIKVNGTELAEVDIVAIAGEKQVAADSPDAVDAAVDLYLLRDYAKKHDITAPTESAGLMDEGTQLEARIFDKAPPPPPGDEPYITVDHAYLFLDKIAKKPEKKKARASAEAFRKAAAADSAKTFESIFADMKLNGEYWHVADNENYAATLFAWVPADAKVGETPKINARPDAMEIVRLKARHDAKYPDKHTWLMETVRATATIEK